MSTPQAQLNTEIRKLEELVSQVIAGYEEENKLSNNINAEMTDIDDFTLGLPVVSYLSDIL